MLLTETVLWGFHDPAMVSIDPNRFLKFRSQALGIKSEDFFTQIDKQTLCNPKNILIHQLVQKTSTEYSDIKTCKYL